MQPAFAAEQFVSDNSVRQDPLQSIKQRGQVNVGEFTGAATYSYPVALPPGRKGLTPSLSISHNSQDSSLNNIVGYHWSLSQYSISRLNTHGVDQLYDRNDFVANLPFESGELTELGGGFYAQKYESSFTSYEFRGDNSWLVTDRQGNSYLFGASDDSRQFDPADPSRTAQWMLQEIRDPNDNFIRYTYQKLGNQIYPASIFYTGHGAVDGIFEVYFSVDTSQVRPDRQYSYATGFLVDTNYLVDDIRIYVEGELRRKIELGYTQENPLVRQTLGSIIETGYDEAGAPTVLPPTTFEYTPSVISWQETDQYEPPIDIVSHNKTYGWVTSNYSAYFDVNGDGLVDLYSGSFLTNQQLYLNDGKGNWVLTDKAGYNLPIPGEPSMDGKFLDFNGDIWRDRFSSFIDHYVYPPQQKSYLMLFGLASVDNSIKATILNGTGATNNDNGASVADLNGDSLPDIIQSRSTFDASEHTVISAETCLNENGDSCALTGLWESPVPIIYDDNISIQKPRSTYIEDCNRDGLADVQGYGGVWLNDGKGGWLTPQADQKCEFTPPDGIFYRSVDLNSDGLLDRAHALLEVGYSVDTVVNKLKLNTGQQYLDDVGDFPVLFGRGNGTGQTGSDNSGIRIMDINGDQLPDVVQSYKLEEQIGANWVTTYTKHVWLHTGSRPYFLKTVHTSSGGEINLEYKTSAQYIKSDGTQANPNLPIIIDTVSRMTISDGQGNISETNYFYEDGHYYFENSYDKAFAGFRVVTKTDGLGYQTKSYYHQSQYSVDDSANGEYADHISKKGRAYRTEVYDQNGQLVTLSINKFEHKSLGTDHFFAYLAQTLSQSFNGGVAKATAKAFTYDDIGNVTQVIDYGEVTASGQSGSFSDTGTDLLKTLISYVSQSSMPYENKLYGQSNALLSHSRTFYDNLPLGQKNKGNATAQEAWLDSNGSWLHSETRYDDYGLPRVTSNPRGLSTSTDYDANNLYPATVRNALAHTTTITYDPAIGQPISVTDPNSSTTTTAYDGLGRPVRTEKDGQLISIIEYNDGASPRYVHQTAYNDDGEKVDAYTYLDALDRNIESKQEAANGKWVASQTIYNQRGNVAKQVQPYFTTSYGFEPLSTTRFGTSFTYDALSRPLTATSTLGTTATSYQGWEVTTVDPNGNPKTLASDARGNLIRVDEKNEGQTYQTYYTYDSVGNLIQIRDAETNIRFFEYDSLGRRTFQSKLGSTAGWNYAYDENSNLIQRTDPKSQVIAYSYDDIDRLFTENELTYTYDQELNAIGRLTKVSKPGYEHSFTYDSWGRVTNENKLIDSKTFDFAYTYDRMGALTSLIYPDGAVAGYHYDSAHQLDQVKVGTKIYASQFTYTPLGQLSQMTLGNGIVLQNTYDENQLYRLTSKTASNGLQNYSYTYDPVGNLLTMVDANSGITAKTVSYQYDDLYRLTSADYQNTANQNDITQAYQYDALGNMTYKSDVGQYVYNGQHPHAVTQAGSHIYDYDDNGNMTVRDTDTMTYDDHDRLILSAEKASFTYGEGYDRLTKTDLATGDITYYASKYFEVHPEKEVKYVYAGDLRIAKIEKELYLAPPPTPDPDPDPTPTPNPTPVTIAPQLPQVSQQGTGGGGGYGSQDALRLMRLISEGKNEEARKLSSKIYLYTLNSIKKEKEESLLAGSLPESAFENLSISYKEDSAEITWDAMPREIASFRIYRSKGNHASALEDTEIFLEEIPASRFTNRFTDRHGEENAKYAYQIKALDEKGKVLLESFKLHANQVFVKEGRQKIVDFRNFSGADFTHVRIKSNTLVDGRETRISQRLVLKPDSDLQSGARLDVNFLICEDKTDGSKYCKKVDQQFVEVYVLDRARPIRKTTAYLKEGISRLSAAFIPEAHADVSDEITFYLLSDHLGSIDAVLDDAGEVVERRDYLPYGQERVSESEANITKTDHKFTGKELDDETGLHYYGARYYDSEMGRFVSVDPWKGNMSDPQSLNKSTYTINNPVKYVDPTGATTEVNEENGAIMNVIDDGSSAIIAYPYVDGVRVEGPGQYWGESSGDVEGPLNNTTWNPITNERILELDPEVQAPATEFINDVQLQTGIQLRISDGHRSNEEQDQLYNQSRTDPPTGPWATNARGGESYHNYGLAVDVVEMEDGACVWEPINSDVANLGYGHGFEWGGHWEAPATDYPHFQRTSGLTISDLQQTTNQ